MSRKNTRTVLSLSALAMLITGAVLYAGPLDPPAGPVTSTYKTLTEVEPRTAINAANTPGDANSSFKITEPGSYYLTGNITGVAGKHGIEIAASGVTIDVNGFDLVGVAGSLDGIAATTSLSNLTIFNGSIRNWGGDGIDFYSTIPAKSARIEGVQVSGNTGYGMRTGDAGVVVKCHAGFNGQTGIEGALVVTDCVAVSNGRFGIWLEAGGTMHNCSATGNADYGIYTNNGVTITNCTSRGNQRGIIVFGDSLVQNCTVVGNTELGISAQSGASVIDCLASDNGTDGIVVLGRCIIRGNTCTSNASDGIFVSSVSGVRIEGNNLSFNGRGLNVSGSANIILRNTAHGNTVVNWSIVANNVVAPIIDRSAVVSAAISGNSAPSSLGTTDETANFTY